MHLKMHSKHQQHGSVGNEIQRLGVNQQNQTAHRFYFGYLFVCLFTKSDLLTCCPGHALESKVGFLQQSERRNQMQLKGSQCTDDVAPGPFGGGGVTVSDVGPHVQASQCAFTGARLVQANDFC